MIFVGILLISILSFDLVKCGTDWNGNNWADDCDYNGDLSKTLNQKYGGQNADYVIEELIEQGKSQDDQLTD